MVLGGNWTGGGREKARTKPNRNSSELRPTATEFSLDFGLNDTRRRNFQDLNKTKHRICTHTHNGSLHFFSAHTSTSPPANFNFYFGGHFSEFGKGSPYAADQ